MEGRNPVPSNTLPAEDPTLSMNERQKLPGLLWMFSYDATGAQLREVEFDPSDAIYHLYRHTRNPFLERALAPATRKLERTPAELNGLFRFLDHWRRYQVAPENDGEPFARRTLQHPPPPPATQPAYLVPERLGGNIARLPWMVEVFFQAVLSRLRENPADFRPVVEELLAQFREDGLRIKVYEAYRTFADWDDLMETLTEIGRYPAPETFDLFCSALFAYYDLVYPPKEG
jgi:hypothetical protein